MHVGQLLDLVAGFDGAGEKVRLSSTDVKHDFENVVILKIVFYIFKTT